MTGSSESSNMFPALAVFSEWYYIVATLLVALIMSIALNYLRDEFQSIRKVKGK